MSVLFVLYTRRGEEIMDAIAKRCGVGNPVQRCGRREAAKKLSVPALPTLVPRSSMFDDEHWAKYKDVGKDIK